MNNMIREQKNKKWSLMIFRQNNRLDYDNINYAKFKFGRTSYEALESMGENLPEGVISLIKSMQLVEEVMETGFVIEFSTYR